MESRQVLKQWVADLRDVEGSLTEWESSFLDSITTQMEKWGNLTDRQQEVLERIYAERTK